MKLLYIGIQQASEKWTMPIQEWGQTITQLSIYFEGRLDDIIKGLRKQNITKVAHEVI